MKNKVSNIVTSVVFCVLIAALTVASMVNPVREFSATENRNLAQMPEFSFDALFSDDDDKKFTLLYEEFITDQFVARDAWITLKTYAERVLGKKESNGVYFGSDGYLIEKHEVPTDQLEKNIEFLKSFLEKTKDYNTHVLIAPTASLILADKLPAYAPVWDQSALLDRLEALGSFVDCRDVLTEHKDEQIYYHADHHWTTLGAYLAYTELCKSLDIEPYAFEDFERRVLANDFAGTLANKVNMKTELDEIFTLEPDVSLNVSYNGGQKVTDTLYEESYLEGRDKYSTFLDGNQPLVDIKTSVENGKTLLLVKDSYSHCMVPMLTAHYERIILMDMRHLNIGVMSYIAQLESEGVTLDDIVVLYNAENFTEDRNMVKFGM